MGFIKDVKQSTAAAHAKRAVEERTIHLAIPVRRARHEFGGFSGLISGAAEVIEAIERQGWTTAQMAYDGQQSKNGAVVLLFRRS